MICNISGNPVLYSGKLFALRGYDGKVLWTRLKKSRILFMNCVDFDVNLDGHLDCITSGDTGLLEAFDIKTGMLSEK